MFPTLLEQPGELFVATQSSAGTAQELLLVKGVNYGAQLLVLCETFQKEPWAEQGGLFLPLEGESVSCL